MAIIPMKQIARLHRKDRSSGIDIYGKSAFLPPVDMKCRIDEGSYVTTDQESVKSGGSVIATAKILFDKLADIGYDDELEYTNELNLTVRKKPKQINVKRDIASKPILTEVFV